MAYKKVYDEIFDEYVNSERYQKDYAEMGGAELYASMEDAVELIAPEKHSAITDAISTPVYEIHQMGFYCGLREAYRHMMREEALA